MVGLLDVQDTAYLPAVVAPFVSSDGVGLGTAMMVTVAVSFAGTVLLNLRATRQPAEIAV